MMKSQNPQRSECIHFFDPFFKNARLLDQANGPYEILCHVVHRAAKVQDVALLEEGCVQHLYRISTRLCSLASSPPIHGTMWQPFSWPGKQGISQWAACCRWKKHGAAGLAEFSQRFAVNT